MTTAGRQRSTQDADPADDPDAVISDRVFDRVYATVNTTLPSGWTDADVVQACATVMGIPIGYMAPLRVQQAPRARTLFNPVRDQLDDVVKNNPGMHWWIADGQIYIANRDDPSHVPPHVEPEPMELVRLPSGQLVVWEREEAPPSEPEKVDRPSAVTRKLEVLTSYWWHRGSGARAVYTHLMDVLWRLEATGGEDTAEKVILQRRHAAARPTDRREGMQNKSIT